MARPESQGLVFLFLPQSEKFSGFLSSTILPRHQWELVLRTGPGSGPGIEGLVLLFRDVHHLHEKLVLDKLASFYGLQRSCEIVRILPGDASSFPAIEFLLFLECFRPKTINMIVTSCFLLMFLCCGCKWPEADAIFQVFYRSLAKLNSQGP